MYNAKFFCFNRFFKIFDITYSLTSTSEAVETATKRVIEDFNKDNVIYLELRSTPRAEKNMSKKNYLEAMIRGVQHCKIHYPNILVKLLISVNRNETIESAKENIELAIEYWKKFPNLILGIDLSGNPTKSKFIDYIDILNKARSEGLKISIHCGEVVDNQEVKNILNFHPDRIGHGTCIHESLGGDKNNWDELLKKKIPVEICITSNIKCKTVNSYDEHHFKFLYENKHPITLCVSNILKSFLYFLVGI